MQRILFAIMLLCALSMARGQTKDVKYHYWFDDDCSTVRQGETDVVTGNLSVDASSLREGFHTIHLQAVDEEGRMSQPMRQGFVKLLEATVTHAFYWFDNDVFHAMQVDMVHGAVNVAINQLRDGFHTIHYLAMQTNGRETQPVSRLFFNPPNDNCIVEYSYWINNNMHTLQKVTFSKQANPFELVTTLDLPTQPLCSSRFYFEQTGGQPTIYPINDLHVRFFDYYHNHTDTVARYADLSAGQEVTDITLLQSDVQETTYVPEENAIKWYKLVATTGDELKFLLNHAATLQVFAPSGDEVLNVSGSTEWNEVQVWERGIYYVALHDVTDTSAETINIDYQLTHTAIAGDVNADGSVDIGDIVMVISVMTGTETDATIVARADVNSDDAADIGDIVSIISIMTGQPAGARANATARIWQQENNDRVSMTMEDNALHLSLDNSRDYTAFQFQLTLPEGTSPDDVTISSLRGQGHVTTVEPMGNGQYLVMGYSLGNKTFNGYSGELLTLNLKGQQTDQVAIDNVIFADAKGQTYRLMGGETTGVGQIDNEKLKMDNSVYDLQGRKVTIGKNGIYLVGNKKVVVK